MLNIDIGVTNDVCSQAPPTLCTIRYPTTTADDDAVSSFVYGYYGKGGVWGVTAVKPAPTAKSEHYFFIQGEIIL